MARGAVVGGVGGGGGAAQGGEAEALRQHHARGGGGCGGGVLAGAGVDHQLCGHLTTLLLGSGNMGQLEHTCTQRGYPSILGTVFHDVAEIYWPRCGCFFLLKASLKLTFSGGIFYNVDVSSELFYSWIH